MIRALWLIGMVAGLLVMPLLAMDMFISMPLLMVYALAAGPVFGLADQKPICRSCGLSRPSPGWHETPVRPLPVPPEGPRVGRGSVASPGALAAAVQPEIQQEEEVSGLRRLPAERPASDE